MSPLDPAILSVVAAVIGTVAGLIALRAARLEYQTAQHGARGAADALAIDPGAPAVASSLPERGRFIDRDPELRDALSRVQAGESVLAIEGDAGIGKTATALELAHRLQDMAAGDELPDPARQTYLWFDCGGRCPDLIALCGSLAALTRDQSLSTVAVDEKLDALRAHLAQRRTVLVLDNIRLGDDDPSAAVRAFLRTVPSGSVVIASVNRPGTLQGARLPLPELDLPYVHEFVRMTARRFSLEGADALDEAFARRLREAVGGNPGTIEWFLQSVSLSSRSAEEYLTAVERGEALPEFRVSIWASLGRTPRLVLAAYACLKGYAIREQLAVATGLDPADVSNALDELAAAGVLTRMPVTDQPDVYKCSAALWRFARVETEPAVLDAIVGRLAAHYVERLAADPENARAAIPHVDAIRAVIDELYHRGRDQELQALYRASLDILYTLGRFDDRLAAGRRAYDSARRAGNHVAASIAAQTRLGAFALRGEFACAREALAHGYEAATLSGSPRELVRQKLCDGFLCYRMREPGQALRIVDGTDGTARREGDLETLVNILILRSAAHWYLGAFEAAEDAARECIRVCEEMGWKRAVAYPLRVQADCAIQRRELARARELLERSREIAVAHEDRRAIARTLLTDARLLLVSRRSRQAERVARRAQAEAAALGLPPEEQEAVALCRAARRALLLPPVRLRYARWPPHRLTDAPVGGG